jgi:hypothetical protein
LTNTAAPPPPTILIKVGSGSPQSAQVGTAFALPLVANVTSNGTALSNATVTFAAPASGASCTLSATTAATDANGNASVTCTANSTAGGPYNVTASTSGATASASFALTNTAPSATVITVASGSPQSALVGTAFALPLVANVTSNGTALSGATVTFAAPLSGASCVLSATTGTTNASGNASVTCTADSTAGGPYNVTATTPGTTTQVSFALTNTSTVGPPAILLATSGGGQSATVSTAFTNPLVATVTDINNVPLPNISVTFTAPATSASGTFATTPPSPSDTELTGSNGQATSHIFTANSTAGPYNVVATSGPKSVNFAETNTAGTAEILTATSGGGQSAAISTAFTLPLVATVTSGGNPVSGVLVTFTPPATGASCVPSATSGTTNASGTVSVTCTANATVGGPYNVMASSSGLTSVNFALTNTLPLAANLTATSGGGQSATLSTPFTSPLVATVTDVHSNPVSGVTVTFTAPASGASATFATTPASTIDPEVTGSNGQATSKTFTANSTAGAYNVAVSSAGLTSVYFPETNNAGVAATLTATSGGGQTAAVSTAFASPFVATVTDSHGNPLSGISVTFAAPASGASCVLSATSATTNASGNASVTCTANSTVGGPYNVVASSTGLTSVNFAETNIVGGGAILTATSGGGQSAAVTTAFANPFVATVTNGGNPVSGVSVTFAAPASGASCVLSATSVTTNASGNASVTCTASSTAGGPYNVVASSSGLASVNFAETNTAGAAATLTATSGVGQSAAISTAFTFPLVATVLDAHSNPVSGVSVTFTAPASGASGTFGTTPPAITDTEVTGSNGQAISHIFTANATVGGPYNVVASSGTLASVNFAETNTVAVAANLTATSGGGQSATVSTAFALPLVATVTDVHGNPISGTAVAFTAPASGASGLFATTPPSTVDVELTGSNGQATSKSFGANATAGTYNVVATSGTLTPVNFAETNTASANILSVTSGSGQSTKVVTPFPHPLVATVTNGGNPVSGVSVTFTAPASGASGLFNTLPSPSTTDTEVTGSNGQATSQVFGANSTAGTYNVVATSGTSTPVNFSETNTAGTATVLTATSGAGQSATVGTAFTNPLIATATDSHGNTVSGVSVTFTAPASGASGTFATTPPSTTDTEVTGSNGQATSHIFTANSTVGGYNVVASASGTTSPTFAETNTASSGETLTATSGGGQSATISTPFALPLVATVTNAGVPVSGVSVTFTAPASGASGLFATTPPSITDTEVTGSNGQATSHIFGANSTAGSYNVVASSSGLTSVNFAETNNAGAAATLTATSGGGQSAAISTAFALPLVATVTDAHSNPVSGVSVTFTAPASGASGTFGTTPPAITDTEVTGSNGQATSKTFTANATLGGYTVVASSGSLAHANFAETNTVVGASSTYVFYASGEDTFQSVVNYYAIAGAVTIDSNGNVTAGEQDYNDAFGASSPGLTADTITGGTLTVNPTTGQGTLTLTTTNDVIGSPAGTEVFAVQFANTNHALIAEFDGWATSSGSLDLQTATTASGNFSFALSGVDFNYNSVAYGGVYNVSGGTANGTLDINDDGSVMTKVAFTSTSTTPDTFGRSTVTGITNPVTSTTITFASYVVGPEVVRLIDIDNGTSLGLSTKDAAVGSAYGQGSSTTFTDASLTSGVFTLLGQFSEAYATLGEFTTNSAGNFTTGLADDNELDNGVQVTADSISGSSYDLVTSGINGYGSMTIVWATQGPTPPSVGALGVYMVDPKLNINDPNNTKTDLGGALIVDLDGGLTSALPGGMGVITPQTNTATSAFNGNYVAGFQNFNNFTNCPACEFDMVSQGTMATGAALSLTGDDSDPFGTWTGTPAQSTGDTFTSTPLSAGTGIYSMTTANSNPLDATINTTAGPMDVDIYQASGTTLYWIELTNSVTNTFGVFLGPIETFTGAPTFQPAGETKPQPNTNVKPTQGLGGTVH